MNPLEERAKAKKEELRQLQDQLRMERQKMQTSLPYEKFYGKSLGNWGEPYDKIMEEFEEMFEEDKCRLCGKESNYQRDLLGSLGICKKCLKPVIKEVFEGLVREKVLKSKKPYCKNCFSVIEACNCPERKNLKKLKR